MATNSNAGRQGTGKTNGGMAGKTVRAGSAANAGRTVNAKGTAGAAKSGNPANSGQTAGAGKTVKAGDTGRTGKRGIRRLKRSICRTLGALFLASSLVVAAIPVDGLQAAPGDTYTDESVTVNVYENNGVPEVDKNATVYSYFMEGTGVTFRFAYVSVNGKEEGDSRYAVILGYEQIGDLADGVLNVPSNMEAYRKYSVESTDTGSAAVNLKNEFLYYNRPEDTDVQETDSQGNPKVDGQGNPIYVKRDVFYPCYYSTRATWINDKELYVRNKDLDSEGNPTYSLSQDERIAKAQVAYIGTQCLKLSTDPDKEYVIGDRVSKPEEGVFYAKTNITTLRLPDSITGIGDYAFANCGFVTVKFGNGLRCLGKYVFSGCGSMTQADFDVTCGLLKMGEGCFMNCGKLSSINMPGHVQEIGDFAFMGCSELTNVNMIHLNLTNKDGEKFDLEGQLTKLGRGVFENCVSLENIVFPNSYAGEVDVSEFRGCTSLEYIRSGYRDDRADGNATFNLKDGGLTGWGWTQFLAQCPKNAEGTESRFYLWGRKNSNLHKKATEKQIAFKFYDDNMKMNVYEKVVEEEGTGKTAVYWVNDNNELVSCTIDPSLKNLTLPETIGPKNINSIGSNTFQNKCNLEVVTIPASVATIADNAFRGCHNLRTVIFTNAERVSSIGVGAFDTQEFTAGHLSGCPGTLQSDWYLNFVGTISPKSVPFLYAMSAPGDIGLGNSRKTHLTYYSGFPTHLVVRHNDVTGLNELIDYPTFNDLASGRYTRAHGFDYMSEENEKETASAMANYPNGLTNYQRETIVNAVLNLKLPEGIESVATVEVTGTTRAAGGAKLVDSALTGTAVAAENDEAVNLGREDSQRIGLFNYKENNNGTVLLKDRGMTKDPTGGTMTDSERANSGLRKTLVSANIKSFTPGAFRNCDAFSSISLDGDVEAVGHYAFADCDNLSSVSIAESVSALGRVPFIDSKSLSTVDFNGSSNYSCEKSIVYKLNDSGEKETLVEYLYARSNPMVGTDEVSSVSEIAPEAFSRTNVVIADFGQSTISGVPKDAFRETTKLVEVTLPTTCTSISENAFSDSNIQQLKVPGTVAVINPQAFENVDKSLIFKTPEGSIAYTYAKEHGFQWEGAEDPVYCDVTFMSGYDFSILGTRKVLRGENVTAPQVPDVEGKTFTGWSRSLENITEDVTIIALYEDIKAATYTVEFFDWDDTPVKTTVVAEGEDASRYAPTDLSREGYRFTGWDRPINNVRSNISTKATYEKIDSSELTSYTVRFTDWDGKVISTQTVAQGKDAVIPKDPVRAGYTFTGWVPQPVKVTRDMDTVAQYTPNGLTPGTSPTPGPGSSPTPAPGSSPTPAPGSSPTPAPGDNGGGGGWDDDDDDDDDDNGDNQLFTLTVLNGSGSGSFLPNSMPVIIADQASSTQEFDHWTIQPEQALIASKTLQSTVITMPHCDVIVTAHYRTKAGVSPTPPVNPPVSTVRPSGGNNNNNTAGGTTVVIDKNGLSNTGVVNVVINGSSDNFVLKVEENSSATEAVLRALIAEYGSLENIKYFPMDITLYDATGSRRITDTTGLKIDITLPLPDSLKIYAGNNKVAGVVNDKLDKLSPRFTTINGVPCVTFSAEHFSPYVIYVDTSRLGQGTGADDTPKTGDPIHPKWFLSIGLACLSFVMFMQRDTKKKKKVAVRAK